jgi:hypothetical protein
LWNDCENDQLSKRRGVPYGPLGMRPQGRKGIDNQEEVEEHPSADRSRSRAFAQFAALQGGRAWVQDCPGGGASFRVLLPANPDLSR